MQVGAVRVAQRGLMKTLHGLGPVFLFHRRFAGGVVRIACSGVGGVFVRFCDGDRRQRMPRRKQKLLIYVVSVEHARFAVR